MIKILVLEGDRHFQDGDRITRCIRAFERDGHEVRVLFNAYLLEDSELMAGLAWADVLATQTTFVDYRVGDMVHKLLKFPKPLEIYVMGYRVAHSISSMLSDEDCWKLKHQIYEMNLAFRDGPQADLKRIDFSERVARHQALVDEIEAREKFESEYSGSAKQRPTGREIKVKRCTAYGKAFETLRPGQVLPELDMHEIDPNPDRGVWVWGNGEPVKLVNDQGSDEYEIVSHTGVSSVVDEVFSILGVSRDGVSELMVKGIVLECHTLDAAELTHSINTLLEHLELPRRGNRHNLLALLQNFSRAQTVAP